MRKRRISTTVWIAILVTAALLVLNTILDLASIRKSEETIKNLVSKRMLDLSVVASRSLDGDEVAAFSEADVGSPLEEKIKSSLSIFLETDGVIYIYLGRAMEGKGVCFVVDTDPVDPGRFGEKIVQTEALLNASAGMAAFDEEAYSDRWGRFYSAYAPVFTSEGTVAGVVGVDFDAELYRSEMRATAWMILAISIGSFLVGALIVFFIFNLVKRRFRILNSKLSRLADDIDGLNQEMLSNSVVLRGEAPDDSSYQAVRDMIHQHKNAEKNGSGDTIELLGEKIQVMQSQLKVFIERMHEQAYLDPGTGVRNKTAYLELVKCLDIAIAEKTAAFAVVVFDLNGLKQVNDIHGHAVGDLFIQNTAAVLKKIFGFEELFRIGGDEFIAVIENCDREKLDGIFRRLPEETERFNSEMEAGGIPVSFSAGGTVFDPETDHYFREVFARADEEMYRAKAKYYEGAADRRRDLSQYW